MVMRIPVWELCGQTWTHLNCRLTADQSVSKFLHGFLGKFDLALVVANKNGNCSILTGSSLCPFLSRWRFVSVKPERTQNTGHRDFH